MPGYTTSSDAGCTIRAMARVPVEAFGPARSCRPSGSGPLRERHSSHGEMSRKSWLPGTSTTSPSAPSASPTALSTGRAASSASYMGPWRSSSRSPRIDQAVDAVEGGEEGGLGSGPAQDVDVAASPEMEV